MSASQTIRTLKLSLLADTSGFGRNLQTAQSNFDSFQRGISRAAVPAAAAIAGIGAAAFSAIDAAADLEQTFGAVEQVFGGRAARRLDQFAREAADSLGQSRQEALGAAQQFGILGRAAELEGEELADFAIQLTTLASDLAAFGNTTPQQAIEALGSALRGEFNPIERFGVVLNAAAVESIALREGLADTAAEITAADQVYARFLGIVEETAIQQGQAARESESLASQTNQAKANLENFRIELGEQLLPVLTEALPLLSGIVEQFANSDPELIVALGTAILGLSVAINALNASLKAFAAVQGVFRFLAGTVGGFFTAAAAGPVLGLSTIGVVQERGLTDVQGQVSTGGLSGLLAGPPTFPRTQSSRQGGRETGVTRVEVNVGGFVGNNRELARAIQRALEQARRSGAQREVIVG